MSIVKKWLINCKCRHAFYVPWTKETATQKVKGFFGLGKVMCPMCGTKDTEVVKLIKKKKRE